MHRPLSALQPLVGAAELSDADRMQWWQDAKFGLFLHWGLYTVAGGVWQGQPTKGAEHFMLYQRIPLKEYATLADNFNPVKFDADAWVRSAKGAGMEYLVITAKHHEGFAMYNSPSNDYNIVKRTPYGKDPMKPLADACHRHDLKLGFYYSLGRDWADPDVPTNWPTKAGRSNTWDYPDEDGKVFSRYFARKVKPQLRELLTQYGPVAIVWFDTPELISADESRELKAMIRRLQPACIVDDRIGNGQGDFVTAEQKLDTVNTARPWEACMTMSRHWGYFQNETGYKSPEVILRDLISVVSRGGNLLLDIGPTPQGEFPPQSVDRLRAIGTWMDVYASALQGTRPWKHASEQVALAESSATPVAPSAPGANGVAADAINDATPTDTVPELRFTNKDKNIYLFAISWHMPVIISKTLAATEVIITNVEFLGSHERIVWTQDDKGLRIDLPKVEQAIPIYVFRLHVTEILQES
ncbi:MAG TPA: alpha-L-fucosidase [Acidobacteriaceae bacterium]